MPATQAPAQSNPPPAAQTRKEGSLAHLRELHRTVGLPVDRIRDVVISHEADARGVHLINTVLQHIAASDRHGVLESAIKVNANGSETLAAVMLGSDSIETLAWNKDRFQELVNVYDYQSSLRKQLKSDYRTVYPNKFKAKGNVDAKEAELRGLPFIDHRMRVQQKPDGVFLLSVKDHRGLEQHRLVIAEIDNHAKDDSKDEHDAYKLSCKALQSVDACRSIGGADAAAYVMRVNIKSFDFNALRTQVSTDNHIDLQKIDPKVNQSTDPDAPTKGHLIFNSLYEQLCQQLQYVLLAICFDIKYGNFIKRELLSGAPTAPIYDYFFYVNFPFAPASGKFDLHTSDADKFRKDVCKWHTDARISLMSANRKPVFTAECSAQRIVPRAMVSAVQRIDAVALLTALRESDPLKRSKKVDNVPGAMYLTDILTVCKDAKAVENCGLVRGNNPSTTPAERHIAAYVPKQTLKIKPGAAIAKTLNVGSSAAVDVLLPVDENLENTPENFPFAVNSSEPSPDTTSSRFLYEEHYAEVAAVIPDHQDSKNKDNKNLLAIKVYWNKDKQVWNEDISHSEEDAGADGADGDGARRKTDKTPQYKFYAHPNRLLIARLVSVAEACLFDLHARTALWWKPKSWTNMEEYTKGFNQWLRANPEIMRNRGQYALDGLKYTYKGNQEDYFDTQTQLPVAAKRKGLLNKVCHQLRTERPPLDLDLEDLVRPLNVPYALVFLQVLGCLNRLALHELARRFLTGSSLERVQTLLAQFPPGTESELRFLFEYVQSEKVSYLKPPQQPDTNTVQKIATDRIMEDVFKIQRRAGSVLEKQIAVENPVCNKLIMFEQMLHVHDDTVVLQDYTEQSLWTLYFTNLTSTRTCYFIIDTQPKVFPVLLPDRQVCCRDTNAVVAGRPVQEPYDGLGEIENDDLPQLETTPFKTHVLAMHEDERVMWQALLDVADKQVRSKERRSGTRQLSWYWQPDHSDENVAKNRKSKPPDKQKFMEHYHGTAPDTLSPCRYSLFMYSEISETASRKEIDVAILGALGYDTQEVKFSDSSTLALWFTYSPDAIQLLETEWNNLKRNEKLTLPMTDEDGHAWVCCTDWYDNCKRQRGNRDRSHTPHDIIDRYYTRGPSWCDLMWKRMLILVVFTRSPPFDAPPVADQSNLSCVAFKQRTQNSGNDFDKFYAVGMSCDGDNAEDYEVSVNAKYLKYDFESMEDTDEEGALLEAITNENNSKLKRQNLNLVLFNALLRQPGPVSFMWAELFGDNFYETLASGRYQVRRKSLPFMKHYHGTAPDTKDEFITKLCVETYKTQVNLQTNVDTSNTERVLLRDQQTVREKFETLNLEDDFLDFFTSVHEWLHGYKKHD